MNGELQLTRRRPGRRCRGSNSPGKDQPGLADTRLTWMGVQSVIFTATPYFAGQANSQTVQIGRAGDKLTP